MADNWLAATLDENGVLKNKLGIKDPAELAQKEFWLSAKAALQILRHGVKITDIDDLNKIHQIMFGELYEWAGQERQGNFRKGNTEFFPYERFVYAKEDINDILHSLPKTEPLSAIDYAKLLDRINFYHPFREGNGRSSKVFLQCFAMQHGQVIDYPLTNDEIIAAEDAGDVEMSV
ncbi:Fic family protein [Lactobacillus sp. HT06-2]|uniref:Fic/DOC family protein n=1 Tax=Lactobacillus sp. HT06-2 TaxID=2080222 RepID=UPI000CD9CC52|nr:Fic family protein [Lactobacillus sp. HT06-2]